MPPTPVLIHGFLGFDRIGPAEYFRGVPEMLRGMGVDPIVPQVPPAGSIRARAEVLAAVLAGRPGQDFVLLGHSMGGLDARYLAAHLDPGQRIKTVVTVATPHRGSPVARAMLRNWWALPIRLPTQDALRDLDPAIRAAVPIPDRPGVRYVSYTTRRAAAELCLPLRLTAACIAEPNDGMVPLSSAAWGEERGVLRADHFEVVGWSLAAPDMTAERPFDHLAFWRAAVKDAIYG